jgi:tripartite-type tricarboxylate transporter receptor subunit TctC
MPELPSVAESGLPGYESISCYGLIAPRNLPKPVVERVNTEVNKILKSKEMIDRLAADGVSAVGGTPEQFLALIKRDIGTWGRIVRKAGIKAE